MILFNLINCRAHEQVDNSDLSVFTYKTLPFPKRQNCLINTSLLPISKTELDGPAWLEMDFQQKHISQLLRNRLLPLIPPSSSLCSLHDGPVEPRPILQGFQALFAFHKNQKRGLIDQGMEGGDGWSLPVFSSFPPCFLSFLLISCLAPL